MKRKSPQGDLKQEAHRKVVFWTVIIVIIAKLFSGQKQMIMMIMIMILITVLIVLNILIVMTVIIVITLMI